MGKEKPLPEISKSDLDEIKQYIKSSDLKSIGFYMFEKINDYFEFNEAIRNDKRAKFMSSVTNEFYGTYNSFRELPDEELQIALEKQMHYHIDFMLMAQSQEKSSKK